MKNEQYTFTSWQACREYFDKEVLNKDPKWTIGENITLMMVADGSSH